MALTYWPLDSGILIPFARPKGRRLIVTQFEDGPPEVRLRNRAAPGMLNGSLRLTGAQYRVFEAWGEDILQDWSLPFRWRDPRDDRILQMQFSTEPSPGADCIAGEGLDADKSVWTVQVSLFVSD